MRGATVSRSTSHIAVVYLLRLSEFRRQSRVFADSYRTHRAGQQHDLFVVFKGPFSEAHLEEIRTIFRGIEFTPLFLSDGVGRDIHAFREAVKAIEHEVVCFLNTHSKILANDWLFKLYRVWESGEAGLVGACGSLESISTSYKFIIESQLRYLSGEMTFKEARAFRPFLPARRFLVALRWLAYRVKRYVIRNLLRFFGIGLSLAQSGPNWASFVQANEHIVEFPLFPNPHIRTNAFLTSRHDFLATELQGKSLLAQCSLFESGPESLSRGVLASGRSIRVVDSFGRTFSPSEWHLSLTFRSGRQENLLVADNRTEDFARASRLEKLTYQQLTWGVKSSLQKSTFYPELQSTKPSHDSLKSDVSGDVNVRDASRSDRTRFLIVVPSHNGHELVGDVIHSVREQRYPAWHMHIFDNASDPPLSEYLSQITDARIRVSRSTKFLPVTESWNAAIGSLDRYREIADYVIILGSDDGLVPSSLERLANQMAQFESPDVVIGPLVQFIHPNVYQAHPDGVVKTIATAPFMQGLRFPFLVPNSVCQELVDGSLNLRRQFLFQMPAFAWKLDFLRRVMVDGRLFQSEFPDYYLANLGMERADSVLAVPDAIGFQGVSRQSFGYGILNSQTSLGFSRLGQNIEKYPALGNSALPGSQYLSTYMETMFAVKSMSHRERRGPNVQRYRSIRVSQEVRAIAEPLAFGDGLSGLRFERRARRTFLKSLSIWERLLAIRLGVALGLSRLFPKLFKFLNNFSDFEVNTFTSEEILPAFKPRNNKELFELLAAPPGPTLS